MKQIFQNLSNGETKVINTPSPKAVPGEILISTSKSLVSAGTERMLVDFGKANWVKKVRSQPDKVKAVLEKAQTDGLSSTYEAVKSKLDQPIPLGYCNVGTVVNTDVMDFELGDRVVSNGSHAEVVRVAKNLVAKIPDEVDKN